MKKKIIEKRIPFDLQATSNDSGQSWLLMAILAQAKRDYRREDFQQDVEQFLTTDWFVDICTWLSFDPFSVQQAIENVEDELFEITF